MLISSKSARKLTTAKIDVSDKYWRPASTKLTPSRKVLGLLKILDLLEMTRANR